MIQADNKLLRTRNIGYERIVQPFSKNYQIKEEFDYDFFSPEPEKKFKRKDIFFVSVKTKKIPKNFWYHLEAKSKKKTIFKAVKLDNGVLTGNGFIYEGSYEFEPATEKSINLEVTIFE